MPSIALVPHICLNVTFLEENLSDPLLWFGCTQNSWLDWGLTVGSDSDLVFSNLVGWLIVGWLMVGWLVVGWIGAHSWKWLTHSCGHISTSLPFISSAAFLLLQLGFLQFLGSLFWSDSSSINFWVHYCAPNTFLAFDYHLHNDLNPTPLIQ